jgi:hypothetical protein
VTRKKTSELKHSFTVEPEIYELQKSNEKLLSTPPREGTAVFDKDYVAPNALQFFQMETKSRKVINELMKPINRDMEEEKLVLADFSVKLNNFIARLQKVEHVVGLEGAKPVVFVELENRIAENCVRIEVDKQQLMDEIAKTNRSIGKLQNNFDDSIKHMETLEQLQKFNSQQVLDCLEQMTKLDTRFSHEIGNVQAGLIDLRSKFEQQTTKLSQAVESM